MTNSFYAIAHKVPNVKGQWAIKNVNHKGNLFVKNPCFSDKTPNNVVVEILIKNNEV